MSKIKFIVLATLFLFGLSGCWYEYFEKEIEYIYKVDSISLIQDNYIFPHCTKDPAFDMESRQFYSAVDSSLVIRGYRHKTHWWFPYYAVDWRITKIDVITLVDFDEKHLAGESLNDLLRIRYMPKECNHVITKRLSDIGYGDLMLGYYRPQPDFNSDNELFLRSLSLGFIDDDGTAKLSNFEVRIEDAFGRIFVARSEEKSKK